MLCFRGQEPQYVAYSTVKSSDSESSQHKRRRSYNSSSYHGSPAHRAPLSSEYPYREISHQGPDFQQSPPNTSQGNYEEFVDPSIHSPYSSQAANVRGISPRIRRKADEIEDQGSVISDYPGNNSFSYSDEDKTLSRSQRQGEYKANYQDASFCSSGS